jgi:hypothetical protein
MEKLCDIMTQFENAERSAWMSDRTSSNDIVESKCSETFPSHIMDCYNNDIRMTVYKREFFDGLHGRMDIRLGGRRYDMHFAWMQRSYVNQGGR